MIVPHVSPVILPLIFWWYILGPWAVPNTKKKFNSSSEENESMCQFRYFTVFCLEVENTFRSVNENFVLCDINRGDRDRMLDGL